MSFLAVTIPVSLLLAAVLLALVVRAAREGAFDDWEGPAARHLFDDDRWPEHEDPSGWREPEEPSRASDDPAQEGR